MNLKLFRAIVACDVDGEPQILNLYVIMMPTCGRVVLEWHEIEDPPGYLCHGRYVDMPINSFQMMEGPLEPMEITVSIPASMKWVTPQDHENVACFPKSEFSGFDSGLI